MGDVILNLMLENGVPFDEACFYYVCACVVFLASFNSCIDFAIDLSKIFTLFLKKVFRKIGCKRKERADTRSSPL